MAISELVSVPNDGRATITLRAKSAVSRTQSPFTFGEQVQSYPGRRWIAEIEVIPLDTRKSGGAWEAFLLKADGGKRRFLLGDPARKKPYGQTTFTIQEQELLADDGSVLQADNGDPLLVDQAVGSTFSVALELRRSANKRGEELEVIGLQPGAEIIAVGDNIQLGTGLNARLHKIVSLDYNPLVNTAVMDVWPPLRENYPIGEPVILDNPRGVFRLTTNTAEWSIEPPTIYSFSLEAAEVV